MITSQHFCLFFDITQTVASVIYHDVAYDPLITYEKDPDFPSIVETDSAWFRNCLANLVGNAKKHGPKASKITVRLLWLAKSSTIKVEVEDEGKGVSVQQAMSLFCEDSTRQGSNTHGISSLSGIGLQAVRTYITGLGGTVGADGSIFWLKLPILEEPVTMHPLYLTFTGNAEQGFIDYFQPSVAVITLAVSLYLFMTFLTATITAQNFKNQYLCFEQPQNGSSFPSYRPTQLSLSQNVIEESGVRTLSFILVPCFTVAGVLYLRIWYSKSKCK